MENEHVVIKKISSMLELGAKAICVLCIAAVFIMCIEQVFCRFVLHSTVGYVDELSRYLFIIAVFVGSALSVRDEEHFSLDLIQQLVERKPVLHRMMRLVEWIIVSFFFVVLIHSSFVLARSTSTQYTSYLHMRLCYMYYMMGACGIWMLIYAVIKSVTEIINLFKRNSASEEG